MKHSKKKKTMYPGGGHMRKAKANNNMVKQNMAMGGKLKPVNKDKNPGLAKLPTDVRNKMGFMAMGGMMKADEDFMYGGKMMKKMMKGGKMSMPGFKGFTGASGSAMPKSDKPARRRKEMMYGGKMKKAGHGMKMKKGSMYPGGGRMQHD